MTLLLVRHAHAGAAGSSGGSERALSARGWSQARALVPVIEHHAPKRILSSPLLRCAQTVEPAAESLGLEVETSEGLAEGHAIEALQLVRSLAGEDALLCTHGDVIPEILVALADEDGLDLGPHPRQEKGSVWVLEREGEQFVRATYVAPPG